MPFLLDGNDRLQSLSWTLTGNHWWQRGTLRCFRRVRLYGFLFGLMVTFLIMAVYILTGERKGLLLTPSPYHFGSLINSSPYNLSFSKDYSSIKQVVKSIVSKVEFSSRQVPDRKGLLYSEPQVKNPCWYEEYPGNGTEDPYGKNLYALYSRRFRAVFDHLRSAFRKHLYNTAGKQYRIRCLPYFYIIGQPKCGTTDLYNRLRLHPEVMFTTMKEPHWWTRKRFGIIRLSDGFHDRYPVEDYLDLFDLAAYQIQEHLLRNETTRQKKHNIIIGEASASTMWDNNAWVYFYENSTNGEPPFMVQDFIHAVQPDAKFIVMLRDPVERLYSDYLYFGIANKSAEDFHERVSESLQLFEGCLSESSMRSCVYNTTLNNAMPVRLQVGLYIVYLLDWLTVFKMDQILILRLEDHAANRKYTMRKVFDFLKLGSLTEQKEAEITKSPASNTRRPADKSLGPMLPITKEILQEFYFPFNQRLTQVLKNDSFLWVTDTEDAHN
ncbi:carbohydrate sulfotransferase 15-like isoform X2 [Scleropages formosus]|uniref:carbohydrate sulfotransferase 15-like isoform X2 n=1 Tax=Scleropages formosus TaxID=113540 RepID=UPI0008786BE1|nr:carbohydrate sulfotransferase 15-like isoform X2 [Scleropages formosus]